MKPRSKEEVPDEILKEGRGLLDNRRSGKTRADFGQTPWVEKEGDNHYNESFNYFRRKKVGAN